MPKQQSSLGAVGLKPYTGKLTALDAASAIQAARLNAIELLETATRLHAAERYSHSRVFAVLALEEVGKVQILLALLCGGDRSVDLWRAYRRHTAKTELLNFVIEMRAGAHFPDLPEETLATVRSSGPTPDDLDAHKQLALYSDCFVGVDNRAAVHLPANLEWKDRAEFVLADAKVLVTYLRDYSPEELEVWREILDRPDQSGEGLSEIIKPAYDALVARGFVTPEQWAPILDYVDKHQEPPNDFGKQDA